jgi:3-methylfumaryl-CoA hydratase
MSDAATTGNHEWQRWIGRSETAHDWITEGRVAKLAATFGKAAPAVLPPGWHWVLFAEAVPAQGLGEDGHPRRGGFLPPITLPRRMWAGGRLVWHGELGVGHAVTRTSTIRTVAVKQGASGPLAFVTVAHAIADEQKLLLEEEHDIVYRDAGKPSAEAGDQSAGAPPPEGSWCRRFVADPVLLFRYSALTFNGHRIHYDHPYATEVEGYPGLVVHGPLIATLLLELVGEALPQRRIRRFTYRAHAPLFANRPFFLTGEPQGEAVGLKAVDASGRLAMTGRAELA